jgi:hypothetical protein
MKYCKRVFNRTKKCNKRGWVNINFRPIVLPAFQHLYLHTDKLGIAPGYSCTWLVVVVMMSVLRWVMWSSMGCYGSSEYPWGICLGPSMASLVPQSPADGEPFAF